jgi:hypothetical protein
MYSSELDTARPLAGLVTKDIKSFALNHGEEYRQIGVITMSTTDWIAVPDNPIQRNTEERAKRANHLVVFEPVHAEVSMAMLPDGSRFKIDGHTRAHKWASGDVKNAPRQVEVKVYGCRDIRTVMRLYGRWDSKLAVETTRDQIDGAVRRAEIQFASPMLKGSKFSNALKSLYGEIFGHDKQLWSDPGAMAEAIGLFREELVLLDSVHPTPGRFPAGVVQAALATFLHDGAEAVPFWQSYSNNEGRKSRTHMDAVQGLSDATLSETQKRSRDAHANLFRKGLRAYVAWRKEELFAVGKGQGIRGVAPESAREFCRSAYRRRQSRIV